MGTQVTGRLTALEVKNATKPGLYNNGKGLYLQVTASGTKSWLYRYTFKGKTRDMGLGAYPGVSLAQAITLHTKYKTILKEQKRDPIEVRDAALNDAESERRAQELAQARRMTFKDAVGKYKALPNYGKRVKKGRVVAAGVLPIYSPDFTGTADLTTPNEQPPVIDRALHLMWAARQGKLDGLRVPPIAVVSLPTVGTTVRAAMTAAGLSVAADRAVLAIPTYAFPTGPARYSGDTLLPNPQVRVAAALPVI